MKNKFRYLLLVIFYTLLTFKAVHSNEPFVFNVTEIEILENGNQINGYKGGTVTSEDGSTITAKNFFYNKLTNILDAVDEKVKTLNCKKDSKKGCNNKSVKCITHNLWDKLDKHINGFFENVRLEELVKR